MLSASIAIIQGLTRELHRLERDSLEAVKSAARRRLDNRSNAWDHTRQQHDDDDDDDGGGEASRPRVVPPSSQPSLATARSEPSRGSQLPSSSPLRGATDLSLQDSWMSGAGSSFRESSVPRSRGSGSEQARTKRSQLCFSLRVASPLPTDTTARSRSTRRRRRAGPSGEAQAARGNETNPSSKSKLRVRARSASLLTSRPGAWARSMAMQTAARPTQPRAGSAVWAQHDALRLDNRRLR